MKTFLHLKIGTRLALAFGILMGLLLLLSVVAALQAGRLQADSSYLRTNVVPSLGMVHTMVAETGRLIPSRLYTVNQHDILTGTQADGTAFPPDKDMTCGNWTKSGEGNAMVGHADRMGLRDDDASKSWNTSHPSRACDAASLVATGGAGLVYCFAAD